MPVAKIIEIVGGSQKSWEDAVQTAVKQAGKTIRNIRGVKVTDMTALVKDNHITQYRATVKISFGLEG